MVQTLARPIYVLDPTPEYTEAKVALAKRPKTLDGKTVGLLWNGKLNGDKLLEAVRGLLADQYEIKSVVRAEKPTATKVASPEMIKTFAEACDVVITSSGD